MKVTQKLTFFILAILLSLSIVSCSSSSSTVANTVPADVLEGTAATGKGIDGIVYVRDANGVEVNVATDPVSGDYSIQVPNMAPPFVIKVIPNDGSAPLYSFATAAGQVVNVTPLTNLAMSLAIANGDLGNLYDNWDGTGVTEAKVNEAEAVLTANLSTQITNAGLSPDTFDLFNDGFSADGTGFDGVLDDLTFSSDAGGVITFVDDSNAGFTFDPDIDVAGNMGDVGGNVDDGGAIAANEVAATLPASFQTTYDLIFILAGGVEAASSPYADGETLSFTVGADNSLSFAGITLTNPVFRNGNVSEAIWKQGSAGLEFALSALPNPAFNSAGSFNEINLSTGAPGDAGFAFLGQFRDAAKELIRLQSAGTVSISGAGATKFDAAELSPTVGSTVTVDSMQSYTWFFKSVTDDTVSYSMNISVNTGNTPLVILSIAKSTQGATFSSTDTWRLDGTALADLVGVSIDDAASTVTFTGVTLARSGRDEIMLDGTFEFYDFSQ